MKKIINNKRHDTENMEEIKTYCQATQQYDNEYLKLFKFGKKFFAEQYTGTDTNYFILSAKTADEAKEAIVDYLYETIDLIVSDFQNSYILELAKWNLIKLENVQADYKGDVEIIEERHFNGYYPLISHGVYDIAQGKKEIKKLENGDVYYLSHNETGRPQFYLIEA